MRNQSPSGHNRHIETASEIEHRLEDATTVADTRVGLALARLAARRVIPKEDIYALDNAARRLRNEFVYGADGKPEGLLPVSAAEAAASWDAAPQRIDNDAPEPDWREKQTPNGDRI